MTAVVATGTRSWCQARGSFWKRQTCRDRGSTGMGVGGAQVYREGPELKFGPYQGYALGPELSLMGRGQPSSQHRLSGLGS